MSIGYENRSPKEFLSSLSNETLDLNIQAAHSLHEGLKTVKDQAHLQAICTGVFNLMVEKIPKDSLSDVDILKINLLATAIDSGLNLEETKQSAHELLGTFCLEAVTRGLTALTPTDGRPN